MILLFVSGRNSKEYQMTSTMQSRGLQAKPTISPTQLLQDVLYILYHETIQRYIYAIPNNVCSNIHLHPKYLAAHPFLVMFK